MRLNSEYTIRRKYFSWREPKWECRECFEPWMWVWSKGDKCG